MERVLPSAFHVLLPPEPKPLIRFHATDDAVDGSSGFYQKVTQKLQTHPPAPILRAATFTHMRLLLEKYGPVLAQIMANDEDLVLVKTVAHDETRSVAAPRADDDVAPARAHDLPELLLHFFRGFLRVLREHQATCATEGVKGHENWYRLLDVGWRYRRALESVLDELEQEVVPVETTADEENQLLDVLRVAYRSGESS
ncbi:hypothetical protein PsorP6_013903 [Peronosclerospora sorghi]|uniref:Uncharacterized protein n=1 Tax=Peronosclerospora sorghi TaxID=230839 RepID=A0ACC0VJ37_9STRA|nr:hypothetical protein PsorP6_013903 [Peronosclerospora sorghi]